MVEIVVFPDVESLVMTYLSAQLADRGDSTPVVRTVPETPPGRIVRLSSFWGEDTGRALASRFVTVQCTDATNADAAALAELCFAILRGARHDPSIPSVRDVVAVDRPADRLPEPDPYRPNYQFTLSFLLRGQAQ
ncbi:MULTISPECIES: hypothetical protein [unclassified Nocardia]|uniref:hypothetical protein n=1 Tax=unclassified Nocardia TaxID=2637762 RepID=UPI0024A9AF48|nr:MULTISPECIES: hypothetical protein [unclassified Nocardia]